MPYSAYIFDVEGTLVDSVPQGLLSLQESLAGFGIIVPYELLQLYSGLDGNQTLQLVAPELRADQRKTILESRGKIYEAKFLGNVKAFDGVRDVFEARHRAPLAAHAGPFPCNRSGQATAGSVRM